MKIRCTNCITSTDKKVLTPFVKGSVYDAEPLIIKGKIIPNEWVINGAERPHKHDSGWIAIACWKVGMFIPGIATFDEVKDAPAI